MNRTLSLRAALGIVPGGRRMAINLAAIIVSVQCALWAQAGSIIVPGAYATTEVNWGVDRAHTPPARFQQIYHATEFSTLGGPVLITGIVARPHMTMQTGPAVVSAGNIDAWLSTTSRTSNTLSTNFAANRGADHTLVGSYDPTSSIVATANLPGPGNTKQFDIDTIFVTPFLYNPAAGNLLLEVRTDGTSLISGSEFITSACGTGPSCPMRMVISVGAPDATSGVYQNIGEISQFLYEPIAAADFDKDGDVDANDLMLWQAAYGLSAGGDTDGDGDTDGRDFLVWQRQYIAGVPGLGRELAIPEPATLLLALMALVGGVRAVPR